MTDTDECHRPTGAPFSENEDYQFLQRAIDELDGLTVPTDARLVAWMPTSIRGGEHLSNITIVLTYESTISQVRTGTAYLVITATLNSNTDSFHDGKCETLGNLEESTLLSATQRGYLIALTNKEVRMLPDIPFWERTVTAAEKTGPSFPDLRGDTPLYSGVDPRASTTVSMLLVCRNRVTGIITTLSTDRLDGDVPDSIMWDSGNSLAAVEMDLGNPIVEALKWFSAFDKRDRQ